MPDRLVLFDIDGTLLSAREAFRTALSEALSTTFGTTGPMAGFDFSGRTDPAIVRGLMLAAGIEAAVIDARLDRALAGYQANLVPLLGPHAVQAKPGIPGLIQRLAADATVTLGLQTGNLERCARAKLAPLDLNRYFPLGAFGSDHENRHELPAIAVQRAYRATGRRFAGKSIVVVGDSIHDVRCGQSLGVRAVAVASGTTSRDSLSAEGPDVLLDDFADVEAALAAILGDGSR
jgi:phosphoglycolate phosphatase-like HAD superfamily hydrolase